MNEGIQKRKSWDIIPEGGNGREAARAATNPPPRFKKKQKPFLLADGRVNGRDRVMSLLLGPDLQPWFGVCVLFVSCGWGHAGPLLFPAGNRGINTWLIASCKWIPLFPQTTTARVHLLFLHECRPEVVSFCLSDLPTGLWPWKDMDNDAGILLGAHPRSTRTSDVREHIKP